MKVLGLEIVSSRSVTESRGDADLLSDRFWADKLGSLSTSGARVTPESAMRSTAVFACVNLIARTIATLPCITYRRLDGGGKERAVDHRLYHVLQLRPNNWMTRVEFYELMMWSLLLRGNFYSQIYESPRFGLQLVPLFTDFMTPKLDLKQFELTYSYRAAGVERKFQAGEILHIKGPTKDGVVGESPLQVARESVGLTITMDEYSSKSFANGVRLSGILKHPEKLTDEVAKRIADSFRNAYSGAQNAGKIAVIEEGMEFMPWSMTNKDAEFLDSRKFQIGEICRLFLVPPHLIGDLSRSTNNNIEQQAIEFVTHCIRPWLVRVEQAMARALFSPEEEEFYTIEFNADGILRGDIKSRFEAYSLGINMGALRPNEIRELENRNPLEQGDYTLVPLNMKPVSNIQDLKDWNNVNGKVTAPATDSQKKSAFTDALATMRSVFKPMFVAEFGRLLHKEAVAFGKDYSSKEEFSKRVSKFFEFHPARTREVLEPLVSAFDTQLRFVAGLCGVDVAVLPKDLVADYASEFSGKRFESLWTTEPESVQTLLQSDSKTVVFDEADAVINKLLALAVEGA